MLDVEEYFVFNADYTLGNPPLLAFRMSEKRILETVEVKKNRVFSKELNLEIVDTGETMRLFNPAINDFLPTFAELSAFKKITDEKEILQTEYEISKNENEAMARRIAELEALLKK